MKGYAMRAIDHTARSNETTIEPAIESTIESVIRFDRFHVLPHSRRLLADGHPVELGSRAFDLLLALLNSGGVLVTKEELVARTWPQSIVSESNLRVQIAALRNALSPDKGIIKSVSGRGYVFTAPISTFEQPIPPPKAKALGDTLKPELAQSPSPSASSTWSHPEGRLTIAIIDDDSGIREALRGLLLSVGLNAEVFSSTREFLQSSAALGCRCLILDVRLPERSGLDFYDDLVSAHVHLPVIFISGHADPPMSTRAMNAGAVEFLTKPVRHKDLLNAIQLATKGSNKARPKDHSSAPAS
jgi:DNA-binding response OmpR family regulator